MPELKKVATRESYGHALVELGKKHDDLIVLDADLAEATKTNLFRKEFLHFFYFYKVPENRQYLQLATLRYFIYLFLLFPSIDDALEIGSFQRSTTYQATINIRL